MTFMSLGGRQGWLLSYKKGPARQPSVDWGREASSGKDSGIDAHTLPSQTLCLCRVDVIASGPPGPALYFYLCTPGTPGSLATQDNRMGSLSWLLVKAPCMFYDTVI